MAMDIGREIQSITEQILKKYKPDKIILFRSAAREEFTRNNDVDLLNIKKETPLYGADRIRELSRLTGVLEY